MNTKLTYFSASAGNEGVLRELIGAGAGVNLKTIQGMTPL